MMRRRRGARQARERWLAGPSGLLARAINSQAGMAAITPRAGRLISLLDLKPGSRYLDIGCGTAAYAHLLAAGAGLEEPPFTADLVPGPGPVEMLAWPEKLPFRDESFDAISCFYYIRRFDDDVLHALGTELARLLAPGGSALVLEIAPVRSRLLNRLHSWLVSPGCAQTGLRGWGRLVATFSECGFDAIDLVNAGPYLLPPIPRVGVLLRRAPSLPGPEEES